MLHPAQRAQSAAAQGMQTFGKGLLAELRCVSLADVCAEVSGSLQLVMFSESNQSLQKLAAKMWCLCAEDTPKALRWGW